MTYAVGSAIRCQGSEFGSVRCRLKRAYGFSVEEAKIRRYEAVVRIRRHALRASGSARITETSSIWSRAVCFC